MKSREWRRDYANNVKVLVIGAGMMAMEYCRVLLDLNYSPIVIGRGEEKAAKFESEMDIRVLRGGIQKNITAMEKIPSHAIIATNVEQLASCAKVLMKFGVKNILLEKPGAFNRKELEEVDTIAKMENANVYVAYNRRFYASTQKAEQIVVADGGVTSYSFEFTEWGHVISELPLSSEIKEKTLLMNSSHVIDLAFYLGGTPEEISCYTAGGLEWHKHASVYTGAGRSNKGALFSYQANWGAPGRWSVEILTSKHRLYFKPLEQLHIQEIGKLNVEPVEIDDRLDKIYKPGLYKQTEAFLTKGKDGKKKSISEQLEHMKFYEKIDGVEEYIN